jgi:stage II sporulation protein R
VLALGVLALPLAHLHQQYTRPPLPAAATDYVRLQVVANSNLASDQFIKSDVRQATLRLLGAEVHEAPDRASALELVAAMRPHIEASLSEQLACAGVPYGVEVSVGQHDFPAKSYGGIITPPGSYPALRVTLGDGRGDNWWCVLFPPLCLLDAGAGLAVKAPPAGLSWHQDSQDLKIAIEALALQQRQPQLRSWLADWLAAAVHRPWEGLRATGLWSPLQHGEQH